MQFNRSSLASKLFALITVGSLAFTLLLLNFDFSRLLVARDQFNAIANDRRAKRLSEAFSSIAISSRDRQLLNYSRSKEEQRRSEEQLLAEDKCLKALSVDASVRTAAADGYRRHVDAVRRKDWEEILQTITTDDREQLDRLRFALVHRKGVEQKYALLNLLYSRILAWPEIEIKTASLVGFCQKYSAILLRILFSDLYPIENKCYVKQIDSRRATIQVLSSFGIMELRMLKEADAWRCNLFERQFLSEDRYATLGLSSAADDCVSQFLRSGNQSDWKSLLELLDDSSLAWLADLTRTLKSKREGTIRSPAALKWMEMLGESLEGVDVNAENILSVLLSDFRFIAPISKWSLSGMFGIGARNISRRHSLATIYERNQEFSGLEEFFRSHFLLGIVDEGGQTKVCLVDLFLNNNLNAPVGAGLDDARIISVVLSRHLSDSNDFQK